MIRLVVGLGNPGRQYAATRHNFGARVVLAWLGDRAGRPTRQHHGEWWTVTGPAGPTHVLLPLTYMNESGVAVAAARRALALDPAEILVVSDDLDLPLGRLRLRSSGSSGGHRGLRSVIDRLGSDAFPRLRLGIDRPPREFGEDGILNYVLGPFPSTQTSLVSETIALGCDAISACISEGVEAAMAAYNGRFAS